MDSLTKCKGWINIHVSAFDNEVHCSTIPYPTKEEAESALFIGAGFARVAIIEIEFQSFKPEKYNG